MTRLMTAEPWAGRALALLVGLIVGIAVASTCSPIGAVETPMSHASRWFGSRPASPRLRRHQAGHRRAGLSVYPTPSRRTLTRRTPMARMRRTRISGSTQIGSPASAAVDPSHANAASGGVAAPAGEAVAPAGRPSPVSPNPPSAARPVEHHPEHVRVRGPSVPFRARRLAPKRLPRRRPRRQDACWSAVHTGRRAGVLDGREVGMTPVTVRALSFGTHLVRITRDGYVDDERRVSVSAKRPAQSLIVELSRVREAKADAGEGGSARSRPPLIVESRPPGAVVFFETVNAVRHHTPLTPSTQSPPARKPCVSRWMATGAGRRPSRVVAGETQTGSRRHSSNDATGPSNSRHSDAATLESRPQDFRVMNVPPPASSRASSPAKMRRAPSEPLVARRMQSQNPNARTQNVKRRTPNAERRGRQWTPFSRWKTVVGYTGVAAGAEGEARGEVVFNTSMTGYQEVLTDPSYSGQIVT